MNRRSFLRTGAATIAGTACSVAGATKTRIRAAVTPHPTMSTFYLAHELGYFADAGLDVEIEPFTRSYQVMPLLAAGKIDVAFGSPSAALINAIARGARLRIVAARELASNSCGDTGRLFGRRPVFPNGLNDASLLKGKSVAVGPQATIREFTMDVLLRQAGLRSADVRSEPYEAGESMAALLSGRVDVMVSGVQFDHAITASSAQVVRGIGLAQVYPNFQYSHVIYGRNLIDGSPEIGSGFLKAYFRGSESFLSGKTPQFLEEYARSNSMNFKQLREACRNTVMPHGRIDAESLPRFVNWAVEKGYCDASVKRLELTDARFLSKV